MDLRAKTTSPQVRNILLADFRKRIRVVALIDFPFLNNADEFKPVAIVGTSYLNADMCKIESSRKVKDERIVG